MSSSVPDGAQGSGRYWRILTRLSLPAAVVSVQLWFQVGPAAAVAAIVFFAIAPLVLPVLGRRFDEERTRAAGAVLRTGAALFIDELIESPALSAPLTGRVRRTAKRWARGLLTGTVDVLPDGLQWRGGRVCPKLPALWIRWGDVVDVTVDLSPVAPMQSIVTYALRSGDRVTMSVRTDDWILSALNPSTRPHAEALPESGWVGQPPVADQPTVVPGSDRAVFGSIWAAAIIYQLFFVDPTDTEMGNLQFLLICGWFVALILLGRAIAHGSATIAKWAFVACSFALAASVLDFGPIPDIARREILLHFGLAIVTAGFAARWLSPPTAGPQSS